MAVRKKIATKVVEVTNIIPEEITAFDIKDIETYKTTLTKISTGIVLLSSLYCRFITTVFPIFEVIEELVEKPFDSDNRDSLEKSISRFNYLIKTYMLSNESQSQKQLINESHGFEINLDGTDSDLIVSLQFIDNAFMIFFYNIRSHFLSSYYNDKKKLDKIKNNIYDIYNEYISFITDISYIFPSTEILKMVGELINKMESDRENIDINNVKDIYTESKKICFYMEEIYKIIIIIEYALGNSIKISDPMKVNDNIKQMYDIAFNPKKAEEFIEMISASTDNTKYKN